MPRGDNFKGPYGGVPTQRGAIAKHACPMCGRRVLIRVTKHGWPHFKCSTDGGCGYQANANSHEAAARLLQSVESKHWGKGAKSKALEIARMSPGELTGKEDSFETEQDDAKPTPSKSEKTESKNTKGKMWFE